MKIDIYNLEGEKQKSIELPKQFDEEVRFDLIKRAVLAILSKLRTPYGAAPRAGKRHSVYVSKRRRAYKTTYGHGISRIPKKTLWRRGSQFGWVGAYVPGTVGGRKAHPPKPQKIWTQKINKKERRKAIRSALSSIFQSGNLIVVDTRFEDLIKTKDVKEVLKKLKLSDELKRLEIKKIRSGKGKMRGRKYKKKLGPLIVVSRKECNIQKSGNSLQGFNVVYVNEVNANLLTSGHEKPRKAIFSEEAINKLGKENLFLK